MHFFRFLQLNEDEQLETLWFNGEQIGSRRIGEYLILLYQVEGFYVEIFYHLKERKIKKYLSFECLDMLEPYLREINIAPVYKYIKRKPKTPDTRFTSEEIEKIINRQIPGVKSEAASMQKKGFWERLISIFTK